MKFPGRNPVDATPSNPERRRFLGVAGGGLAAAGLTSAVGVVGGRAIDRMGQAGLDTGVRYRPAANVVDRGLVLVTIQLAGGLDFLNTIVPLGSGRYHDLRGKGAIDEASAHRIDDTYGLHNMGFLAERWHAGDLGIVHGVGHPDLTLSHFDSTAIWEAGSIEPGLRTGWLGRALQHYGGADADPLLGVGIGGLSPSLYADGWSPVAIPEDGRLPWSASFIADHPDLVRAHTSLARTAGRDMMMSAGGGEVPLAQQVRTSQVLVREVSERVGGAAALDELARRADQADEDVGGGGAIGHRLAMVADLINGGLPTKAFHVMHDGFDTHADQQAEHPVLVRQLDTALREFMTRLGANRDRVVVATWTEFGRRPEWNGGGTDHGTAGSQFVLGHRVLGGHFGEPVSLDRFDRDENFLVTTDFRDYLGGLIEGGLGVDGRAAVPGSTPMELVS